jgi:hypothetical protein
MSKVETLRHALRDLLAQHQDDRMLPTSVRSLFYELVATEIITKACARPAAPIRILGQRGAQLQQKRLDVGTEISDQERRLVRHLRYGPCASGPRPRLETAVDTEIGDCGLHGHSGKQPRFEPP